MAGDFYPRPPRGGRPVALWPLMPRMRISIHALREEGDHPVRAALQQVFMISIHALREEGDPCRRAHCQTSQISIHALREEGDALPFRSGSGLPNFYPRPPRGGRRVWCYHRSRRRRISIHALREEGDGQPFLVPLCPSVFLSTPSARRATFTSFTALSFTSYFYPRPPRGGRPRQIHFARLYGSISIHALREEGDLRRRTAASNR